MEPILIDTNILVYVYDRRDGSRQGIAKQVVGTLAKTSIGCLSAQCLSEFYNATTRRKANQEPILSMREAINETEKFARTFAIFPVTQQIVLEALRGVYRYQLQLWDAQIWASARLNQISTILSQDFQSGMILEGIRFLNPLLEGFRLQEWL